MKIERGIPVPPRKGRKLSQAAELMLEMKKGESLWMKKSPATAVQFAIRYIGKGKYAVRSENGGTRVWRIK